MEFFIGLLIGLVGGGAAMHYLPNILQAILTKAQVEVTKIGTSI